MLKSISQSLIKDIQNPDRCNLRTKKNYVDGIRTTPSDVMIKGLFFEDRLIGSTRGGEKIEMPKGKNGNTLKSEKDLLALVEDAKQVMMDLGVESIEVQPHWEWEDLNGHPDLIANFNGSKCIIDIKYTETKEDDRFRGWGDPESMDHLQALFYSYLHYKREGSYIPFYYFVFGKSGWVKIIQIKIEEGTMDLFQQQLNIARKDVKQFKPTPIGKFNACRKCDLFDTCESATRTPEVEEIWQ